MDWTLTKSLVLWMRTEIESEKESHPMIIGEFKQISSICKTCQIDRVIVALDERRGSLPLSELLQCRLKGIHVDDGISFRESVLGKLSIEHLPPSAIIFSDGFRGVMIYRGIKRAFDLAASALALVLFLPLSLLIALAIKLDSRGPVLYSQERVGKDGRLFNLFKFRSMTVDAEKDGPVWAVINDQRVTRVGRWLRKLRLDEIAQFINVIRGEMSLVGPRPERPFFVRKLEKKIPFYCHRHAVKPGITGWAQILYPYGATQEDAQEKLKYDLYYIKHLSPIMDLRIITET
ncbi:MAG: TIGR03013 family PEP-CTERM/XrtA system glycosyltransferase, partial [Deltaproteobacteria bacterium]|nr:TIGR03013 family PEP-CTERM/XrtA system glycosyltransferase [Deltaproteobacteria bacterium]